MDDYPSSLGEVAKQQRAAAFPRPGTCPSPIRLLFRRLNHPPVLVDLDLVRHLDGAAVRCGFGPPAAHHATLVRERRLHRVGRALGAGDDRARDLAGHRSHGGADRVAKRWTRLSRIRAARFSRTRSAARRNQGCQGKNGQKNAGVHGSGSLRKRTATKRSVQTRKAVPADSTRMRNLAGRPGSGRHLSC